MPLANSIDVHQHVTPEVYRRSLERIGITGSGERPWPESSADTLLAEMDRTGLAAAVVSVASPGVYFGDLAFTRRLVREVNEALASIVAAHPHRFAAVGVVSLPDSDAAVADIGYALDTLRLDGLLLLTHNGDRYLGDEADVPFYAELDRRKAVVVVHPVRPNLSGFARSSVPDGYTELAFETTRAIANLHWNGIFARFPGIRWVMPHAGGVTPFLISRLGALDEIAQVRARSPAGIRSHLRQLYYDVAQAIDPAPLRALMQVADPERILFGSDFPFARVPDVIGASLAAIAAFDGFDEAQRRKIARDNALALFPRLG